MGLFIHLILNNIDEDFITDDFVYLGGCLLDDVEKFALSLFEKEVVNHHTFSLAIDHPQNTFTILIYFIHTNQLVIDLCFLKVFQYAQDFACL